MTESDELREQARLVMAMMDMVDSGKARIEATDPDDGVGVAWIRVVDAAVIAAARVTAACERGSALNCARLAAVEAERDDIFRELLAITAERDRALARLAPTCEHGQTGWHQTKLGTGFDSCPGPGYSDRRERETY